MQPSINQTIDNRFQLIKKLGESRMSTVFKALDINSDNHVAIKFLKPDSTSKYIEDQIRFKKEAQTISKLENPHIIKFHGTGENNGIPYIIQEMIKGLSLRETISSGNKLSLRDIIIIIQQITEALQYVHSRNIIHRDLKPANIMMMRPSHAQNEQIHIVVMDFGLAHILELTQIKGKDAIVGTFGYMSPEALGIINTAIDERSDLYSLGIIFYELLAKELPFKATEIGSLIHQQAAMTPPSVRKLNPEIPEIIEEILIKLLAKEPDLRYQSASGLLNDLKLFQSGSLNFIIAQKDPKIKLSYQTHLIGRKQEFSLLKNAYNKAIDNNGSICLIGGEAGIGKTRLVDALKQNIYYKGYKKGGLFLQGRCLNQENKIPYHPFKDILNDYLNKIQKLTKEDQEKEALRIHKIAGSLGRIIIQLNPNMEYLLKDEPPLVELESERENQRFLMAASNFLCSLAEQGQTCVLFLDDLQWADEGTLTLLSEIMDKIADTNLFIVGTYRNNEIDTTHSLNKIIQASINNKKPVKNIILEKMGNNKLNELIAQLLGEDLQEAETLSNYLMKKTQGNPFFAITLLRELVQNKAIVWANGSWNTDWDKINQIKITNNIIDLLLKHIENLNDEQQKILRAGSVIGREFEITLLYNLLPYDKENIISIIDTLTQTQLIEEGRNKGSFLFTHDKIHETFLSQINKENLQNLHNQIARSIEALNKDNIDSALFELAYHYTESGDKDKTLEYVLPAAEKAKEGYANEEAIKYFNIGIRILEDKKQKNNNKWIKAKENLSEVYLTVGKSDEAIKTLKEIVSLKEGKLEKARTYRKIGLGYFKKAEYEKCEETLISGISLLGVKIPRTKAQVISTILKGLFTRLLHNIFPFIFIRMKIKNVDEKYREITWFYLTLNWMYIFTDTFKFVSNTFSWLNMAESKIGKSRELAQGMAGYGMLLASIPLFKKAYKFHKKALDMRLDLNDEWGIAQSYHWMGCCLSWQGKYEKSLKMEEKSRAKFKDIGDLWETGIILNHTAFSYLFSSQYNKSIHDYLKYLEISKKTKDTYGTTAALVGITICNIEIGEFQQSEKSIKKALDISHGNSILFGRCFSEKFYGYLLLEKGFYQQSIKYLEKAKKLNEENTFLNEYTVHIYSFLADAYMEKFLLQKRFKKTQKKDELKKIKKTCSKALRQAKKWVNHYGSALRVTAKYYGLKNKKRKAHKYFQKSIAQTKSIGRLFEQAKGHYEYGKFLDSVNKHIEAKDQWQKAYLIFKKIGGKAYIKRCENLLGIIPESQKHDTSVSRQDRLILERRMNTILETSRYLSSIIELDHLLEKIMDHAIELTGAEWGILYLYNDENKDTLEPRIVRNIDGSQFQSIKESRSIIDKVTNTMTPLIISDATTNHEFKDKQSIIKTGLKSILCTPIHVRNKLYGVIYLYSSIIASLFKQEDLDVLNMLCSQAGISIENAILYTEVKEKERLQKEMEIAERIQTAMLPEPPVHDELEISALMRPAEEVGGDYYDIIYDTKKNIWFAIGDVTGHGVTPGLIMMMAQTAFSTILSDKKSCSPKQALLKVNSVLYTNINDRLKEYHFMTMRFLKYLGGGKFKYADGGHPGIIIYRNKTKTFEIAKAQGIYLAIKDNIEKHIKDETIQLNKDDIIILYTDGVTEARNKNDGRLLEVENLTKIIKKNTRKPLNEQAQAILDETMKWCGGHPADDITLLLIKMK